MGLSAVEFEFMAGEGGPNPPDQILTVSNKGIGTLNWEITEDCNWLSAEPNSGSSTGEPDEVTLSVDVSGLDAGIYECQLTVSDPNAENSPQMVAVSLVVSGPIIELSPQLFEFSAPLAGPNPLAQILTIRNGGGGILNWQLGDGCPWLSTDANSGSLTAGQAVPVALCVDVSGLVAGNYACQLTVSDPNAQNSPQVVSVNLAVQGPMIYLSASGFTFIGELNGPNPAEKNLTIYNSGEGVLNWQITEGCDWLSVDPNSGSSTGEQDTVVVSVDVTGLDKGTYYCDLTVSDPNAENSPRVVLIDLLVQVPVIELSASSLTFIARPNGPNPQDQTLTIRNSALVGTLNWQTTEDCNWLSVAPESGSSSGQVNEVTLSVDISGLGVGEYGCDLTVEDANADNSPQIVAVTLYVSGRYWDVPGQFQTIQAAIDAAMPGDTVGIAPGTYTGAGNKNLDFQGKAITVRSMDPNDPCVVATTVIDCQNSGRGFYFHTGEGPTSVLEGLTIKNGCPDNDGGAVYCDHSSPTIRACVITGNCTSQSAYETSHFGGGICAYWGCPIIERCTIVGNVAAHGGGVAAKYGTITATDCVIKDNRARGFLAYHPFRIVLVLGGW
jgi:hypothetical protein